MFLHSQTLPGAQKLFTGLGRAYGSCWSHARHICSQPRVTIPWGHGRIHTDAKDNAFFVPGFVSGFVPVCRKPAEEVKL